jgi:hypothetical protein
MKEAEKRSCKKTTFRNEESAMFYVQKLQETSMNDKIPRNAYFCPDCLLWHITSQKKAFQEYTRSLELKITQQHDVEQKYKSLFTQSQWQQSEINRLTKELQKERKLHKELKMYLEANKPK